MNLPTLTPDQVVFLTSFLPKQMSFQPLSNDSKRPRAPKKLDDSFTSDFTLTPQRRSKKDINSEVKQTPKEDKEDGRMSGRESAKESFKESVRSSGELNRDEAKCSQEKKRMVSSAIQAGKLLSPEREETMTNVLLKLKMHKSSWPFRMPVDPQSQGVPNYYEVVREPMDLKTMDRKLKSHQYSDESQFDEDIRKIIANSFAFNSPDTVYYSLTKDFQNYYEVLRPQLMSPSKKLLPSFEKDRKGNEDYQENQVKEKSSKQEKKVAKEEKKKTLEGQGQKDGKHGRTMLTLSFRQRQRLLTQIQNLSQKGMSQLVSLFWGERAGDWQELQLDLADLNAQQFQKLEHFIGEQ